MLLIKEGTSERSTNERATNKTSTNERGTNEIATNEEGQEVQSDSSYMTLIWLCHLTLGMIPTLTLSLILMLKLLMRKISMIFPCFHMTLMIHVLM